MDRLNGSRTGGRVLVGVALVLGEVVLDGGGGGLVGGGGGVHAAAGPPTVLAVEVETER